MAIEPVEIEFLLKENLTEGSNKAAAAAEVLSRTGEGLAKKIKGQIAEHKSLIRSTEADLRRLEKQLKSAAPGAEYAELATEVKACQKALAEEKDILASLEIQYKATAGSMNRLRKEQRDILNAMASLREAGQQGSQDYATLAARAAELTDTLGDVRQEANALAHDNSGLQGVISGVSGLSGVMTSATGVMGLFVEEQEELERMQTRLQSVMSITMGLQQVMNTLNADSAFRLTTVAKAKNLLTAANTRLATALGISATAATALMAALTLGVSVAITAAIAAYNKYADAQAEARKRAEELLEVEKNGRAEAVRKRFELNNVIESIKTFNGTKEEEKRMIKMLNEKYGETFGYYKTMAEWYDVLRQKSEDYIDVLFREHKIRALMDKAVKKDEELAEAKAKSPSDYISFPDRLGSVMSGFTGKWIDSEDIGKEKRDRAIGILQAEYDKIIAEAEAEQKAIDDLRDKRNIGGNEDPAKVEEERAKARKRIEERAKELADGISKLTDTERALRRDQEDARTIALDEEYERERTSMRTNYARKREEIERQELETKRLIAELRKKGHKLSPDLEASVSAAKHDALIASATAEAAELARLEKKHQDKKKEELDELLERYRSNAQKRIKIDADYEREAKRLRELRTEANATEVDDALLGAKRARDTERRALDEEELQDAQKTSAFLVRLFEDASDKTSREVKRIIEETEALVEYIRSTASEDITAQHGISAQTLRTIQQSPEELDRLTQAIKRQKAELSGRSPFEAFFLALDKGIDKLRKGSKDGIAQGVYTIASAVNNVLSQVEALGKQLSSVFGEELGDDIGSITELIGGMGNTAMGVGRLMGGDVLGGIQSIVQGVSSIFSMSARASEAQRAALQAIAEAQREFQRQYTLTLLKQRLLMQEASTPFGEEKIRKAANALKVLSDATDEYHRRLKGNKPQDKLWGLFRLPTELMKKELDAYQRGVGALQQAMIVTGRERTGFLGWGKGRDTYSSLLSIYPQVIKATGELDTAMLREIINSRKMTDEHKRMLEAILQSEEVMREAQKEFDSYIQESFGSLGASMTSALVESIREGRDALELFADDAAKTLERMGEQMAYSLFFADRFSNLQKKLKDIYKTSDSPERIAYSVKNLLAEFMAGNKTAIKQAKEAMQAFKASAAESGFDLWGHDGVGQRAKAGAFTTMTQEQGTKLEGLFTSGQVHWASLDDQVGGITLSMSRQLDQLSLIARHTAPITDIYTEILAIKRDGISIR